MMRLQVTLNILKYISIQDSPSNTPLLLGDQSDNTLQTIKLNADVTISKENSGGTLGVEGSKITLDGPYLHAASSGYTQYGKKWKLQIEDGRTTFADSAHRDSNISFTNHTGDIFQDEQETYINYIIGEDVGSGNGDTSGKLNILFGNAVAENSNSIGSYNTIMGNYSAKSLDGGLRNTGYGYASLHKLTNGDNNIGVGYYSGYNITTGNYNICIGNGAGPTTSNATETHRLYIDVGESSATGSDENSLIYGDQTSSSAQTLSFNAAVTISKEDK